MVSPTTWRNEITWRWAPLGYQSTVLNCFPILSCNAGSFQVPQLWQQPALHSSTWLKKQGKFTLLWRDHILLSSTLPKHKVSLKSFKAQFLLKQPYGWWLLASIWTYYVRGKYQHSNTAVQEENKQTEIPHGAVKYISPEKSILHC